MPRMPDLSNEQCKFLRAFARSPAGPPAGQWPSANVLRQWLARPAFRTRFDELRRAAAFQRNARLDAAALFAAAALHDSARAGDRAAVRNDLELLARIARHRDGGRGA